jgi:lipoyl(octanoyl) transferase
LEAHKQKIRPTLESPGTFKQADWTIDRRLLVANAPLALVWYTSGMQAAIPNQCEVYRLGRVPYVQAWELQERLALQVANGSRLPALLLLEHPHIFTFGRRGTINNLLWDEQERARRGVEVMWVDRGGDVTYHGPGQLVGYPLLPLAPGGLYAGLRKNTLLEIPDELPKADYIGYIRKLEETLILTLARMGIASGQISGKTGVWVQPDVRSRCRNCLPEDRQRPAKIAAIGVKVDARGVSRHGFALNVDPDMSYFEGIIGCGLVDLPVTSLFDMLAPVPSIEEAGDQLMAAFAEVFGYQMIAGEPEKILIGERNFG